MSENHKHMMPDVACQVPAQINGKLSRVGMSGVELPILSPNRILTPAFGNFYVSLDQSQAKGIHMSRLYLLAEKFLEKEVLSLALLEQILDAFLESHKDLSQNAFVDISFQTMLRRPALISANSGWRYYPTRLSASKGSDGCIFELHLQISYSSTCPCSAALARQLIQEQFDKDFAGKTLQFEDIYSWLGSDQGVVATPHSQRSHAEITLRFANSSEELNIEKIIDLIESTLQTAVQAAVKREDEQEFARLNGQNTMFCEDAARRLKGILELSSQFSDYRIEVRHMESLHPHDAVSIVTKGILKGL